jgi:hypothetical protein
VTATYTRLRAPAAVAVPSLLRGLTTRALTFFAPSGAQATIPGTWQRATLTSPAKFGSASPSAPSTSTPF